MKDNSKKLQISIQNLYVDEAETEYYSRLHLKHHPPQLYINEQDTGKPIVSIDLDKRTTNLLLKNLECVQRGLVGCKYSTKKVGFLDRLKNIPKDIKRHPLPYVYATVFVSIFIALYILR